MMHGIRRAFALALGLSLTLCASGVQCEGISEGRESAPSGKLDSPASTGYVVSEAADRLFSEIPSQYIFTSGAGAWSTEITINADGSFSGVFNDTDAGDSGPGYDYTQRHSEFSGQFVNPTQIDEYTWRFELDSLTYDTPVGESEIVPNSNNPDTNVMMIYADAYGIEGGETFYIYEPGTPTALLPEGFTDWAHRYGVIDDSELTSYGIYNLEGQYGFVAKEW